MSGVRCPVAAVRCQVSSVIFDKVVGLVGGESVINKPTLSSLRTKKSISLGTFVFAIQGSHTS